MDRRLNEVCAIEVVLALEDRQLVVALEVAPGTSIDQAIALSGLHSQAGCLNLTNASVGIFGRLRERSWRVADGDRVEIYRSLRADPKATRRQRAAAAKRRL
ncbi:MAG: RnfH family protein [Panacagrimonas sp.]